MNTFKRSANFLVIYSLSALLACLPIILFIPRYIDDYGRGIKGYFGWTESGFRPLADWLYYALNLGNPATALAPLGLILCIPIAALGALAISRAFQVKSPTIAALATLPILINPYFLENLSYGFDSLSMTAALTLAVLAASRIRPILSWRDRAITTALLLVSLLLYQPAFGAYLPLALTAWLWQKPNRKKSPAKRYSEAVSLFSLALCPLLSLTIYSIFVKLFWINRNQYGAGSSILRSSSEMLNGFQETLVVYLQSLWQYWHGNAFATLFLLLIACSSAAMAARLYQDLTMAQSLVIAALLPATLICLAPGPMYILSSVNFSNVPRMNAYLGGLIGGFTLPLASYASALPRRSILKISSIAILSGWAYCQLVFSYAYGHAMQAQREYEQGKLTRMIYDISHLDADRQAKFIQFEGAMPVSPVLANTLRKFPFMDILVPRMINGAWSWGAKQLGWHGFKFKPSYKKPANPEDVLKTQLCENSKASLCSSEYNIVLRGEHLIVRVK